MTGLKVLAEVRLCNHYFISYFLKRKSILLKPNAIVFETNFLSTSLEMEFSSWIDWIENYDTSRKTCPLVELNITTDDAARASNESAGQFLKL